MIKSIRRIEESKKFVIHWRVTEACNYHCSYCVQRDAKIKPHALSIDKQIEIASRTIKAAYLYFKKKLRLVIIGGEPTLVDLPLIFKSIPIELISDISVTSNMSKPVEYYTSLLKLHKKLKFTFSFHFENNDADELCSKAIAIGKFSTYPIQINMVINDENKNIVLKCYDRLKAEKSLKVCVALMRNIDGSISSGIKKLQSTFTDNLPKLLIDSVEYSTSEALCKVSNEKITFKNNYKCSINQDCIRLNNFGRYSKCFIEDWPEGTKPEDVFKTIATCNHTSCNLCRVNRIWKI